MQNKANTREKLVELLKADPCGCFAYNCNPKCKYAKVESCFEERYTDHLIANGVGFVTDNNVGSKWIPVTERLPEIGDTYLVVVKYKYDWEADYTIDTDVAMFHPYDNPDAYIDNRWDTYIDWDEGQQYIHVTHWMPLPEPPEEVKDNA